MVYYLKKSQIGFRRFNDFLGKLMRLTMETGALCMAMAIIDLALFLGFEKTNYHTVPASVISKLYSNSLLVVRCLSIRYHGNYLTVLPIADQRESTIRSCRY